MRSDMAKVLVERPRIKGASFHKPKGYKKRVRKLLDSGDGTPVYEGIKRPHGHATKHFNEHLGPLRRYVQSQIGRPWDKIYSEICERVDRGNVVQKHILTHLFDYVLTQVIWIDGQPCVGATDYWGHWYGRPLRELDLRQICYVCPKSGLLRRMPQRRKPQRKRCPQPPDYIRVSDSLQCRYIAGRWELVTLAPLPDAWHRANADQYDAILNKPVRSLGRSDARAMYGAAVYATSRRVLRKTELQQYPIPIDFIR